MRNGIANPINKTVTYLTSQRQRDIYRVHVRDGMLFKEGRGGGGGGVNDCGEGGGNVDAGGGGARSSRVQQPIRSSSWCRSRPTRTTRAGG